jgi:protein-tyrosine phosphatase
MAGVMRSRESTLPVAAWTARSNRILVVCSANRVRSPIAAALLRARMHEARISGEVRSVGVEAQQAHPMTVRAAQMLEARGLDATHESRRFERCEAAGADLVLTMSRGHLREVVVSEPAMFARTFTLKELVRRAEATPRLPREPWGEWAARLGTDRRPAALMGDSPLDDVADPAGRSTADYVACATELDDLTRRLVCLVWPSRVRR